MASSVANVDTFQYAELFVEFGGEAPKFYGPNGWGDTRPILGEKSCASTDYTWKGVLVLNRLGAAGWRVLSVDRPNGVVYHLVRTIPAGTVAGKWDELPRLPIAVEAASA